MRPDNLLDLFEIGPAPSALPESSGRDPAVPAGPIMVGFDEPKPPAAPAETAPAPAAPREAMPAIGLLASLGVHLLPLLFLLHWEGAPPERAATIPVQLVLEQPPAAAPLPPAPEKAPPPGWIASEEIGGAAAPPAAPQTEATETPTPPPVPPAPEPPPRPEPVAAPAPPPPTPPPRETQTAAVIPPPPEPPPPPKPETHAPPKRPPAPAAHRPAPIPSPVPKEGRVPGPAASRSEYLAYLAALTRRHMNLLPMSVVGQRHGETVLAILVMGDGTIARIRVVQGSGYPDIDTRVEQMVAAVGRFPPLPQWIQTPNLELNLRLRFPEALQQ